MTWRRLPLKRVAGIRVSNVDKKAVDGELRVRLCNYTDVYYRDSIEPSQEFMRATASPEQVSAFRLERGDVVITKDSESADDIGVPTYVERGAPDLVCGYHLALIRPLQGLIDGRFLFWAMTSSTMRRQLEVAATGITRFGLRAEAIGSAALGLPPLPVQRAIADFLDSETARIDALIDKKRGLLELLRQRREGYIEHAIRGLIAEWGEAPLKYLARSVTVGIVVTPAAWYAEAGIPALRGQNVKPGRIVLDDLVHLTHEGHALHRKSELRSGDVVVVRTGQAGAAAVVPPRVAGANCVDLIIVRPGPSADAKFLEHVLNSDWTQKHVEQHSVGTIQSHFNVSAMKAVPVPSAPIRRQREVVASLGKLTARVDSTVARLYRQIDLLAEHRQALITAAVTGQLKVPGVAA